MSRFRIQLGNGHLISIDNGQFVVPISEHQYGGIGLKDYAPELRQLLSIDSSLEHYGFTEPEAIQRAREIARALKPVFQQLPMETDHSDPPVLFIPQKLAEALNLSPNPLLIADFIIRYDQM